LNTSDDKVNDGKDERGVDGDAKEIIEELDEASSFFTISQDALRGFKLSAKEVLR